MNFTFELLLLNFGLFPKATGVGVKGLVESTTHIFAYHQKKLQWKFVVHMFFLIKKKTYNLSVDPSQ